MASTTDFCAKLASAGSAEAEREALAARDKLPPPERAVRYSIRRVADGKVLKVSEFTPDMLDQVEVHLTCQPDAGGRQVVWKPKALESLQALMRE